MTTAARTYRPGTTPDSFLNGAHVIQPVPGWYADPACAGDARWWDGQAWGSQSHPNRSASQAFQHPETMNEHVHDAIDRQWLAKLDRRLRDAKIQVARPVPAAPPVPVQAVVATSSSTFTSKLAARITTERNGGSTWQAIADGLNLDAVPTARGGSLWRIGTVQHAGGHVRPRAGTAAPAGRVGRRVLVSAGT